MEDLSEAFGLNQRASALDPETVSETDVPHGKHQTDPIQGMSSKAAESGQGSSDLRNLGEKKNEKTDKVDRPADDDEGPGIELNRPETETPVGGQRIPPQNPGAPGRNHGTAVDWDTMQKDFLPQGASPHPFPGLSTGGLHSNINPFASVSCTQRQSSRQSSTTAPSPQYTLFGGGQTGGWSQLAPTPPQQVEDKMAALQAAAASGDLQTARWIVKCIEQEAVHNEKEKQMDEMRKLLQQGALLTKKRQETTEPPPPKTNDISRIQLIDIDISSARAAQNSQYLFLSLLKQLKIPLVGGTQTQAEDLSLLIDKWCAKQPDIITSLRNTFMDGGTGADRLRHIERNFIQPKVAKRDTDPEGAIASYDYTKLFSETGMEFQAELLNYRELISRLPADVRASAKYWIKRIKHKAGTELLNNLDRAMREEEEEGDGSISVMSVSRDWTDFAYMMAKAIDIKRQYDSAQEFNPRQQPKIAAHTSDEQQQVSRPGNCTKCDGSLCPYRVSQENECDVYGKMTMSRAAEIMNKVGYKYHVDKMRRRFNLQSISYPHPTSAQKEALASYERHLQNKWGKPPKVNAHGENDAADQHEKQEGHGKADMLTLQKELGIY